MSEIIIKLKDGRNVLKDDFVKASYKMLVDFGYERVSILEIEREIDLLLSGKPNKEDVINTILSDYVGEQL